MRQHHKKNGARGFTLLEILVALAVVAIGTAAVLQSAGATAKSLRVAENRILATWVASNRIAEIRLARLWPPAGTVDRSEILAARTWHYREIVKNTADPDVSRVDVIVYDGPERQHEEATVFGYITRYSPPAAVAPQ